MKITIEMEDKDFLKSTAPFWNGCSFRPIFKADGTVWLDIGCYLLVNLITGVERHFYEMWRDNGEQPFKIDVSPEIKMQMMQEKPCRHCGGAMFESI